MREESSGGEEVPGSVFRVKEKEERTLVRYY
jgi:hypothetical protein